MVQHPYRFSELLLRMLTSRLLCIFMNKFKFLDNVLFVACQEGDSSSKEKLINPQFEEKELCCTVKITI